MSKRVMPYMNLELKSGELMDFVFSLVFHTTTYNYRLYCASMDLDGSRGSAQKLATQIIIPRHYLAGVSVETRTWKIQDLVLRNLI